jgi:hypothetical protein
MLKGIAKAISGLRAWILSIAFLAAIGVVVEGSEPFQACVKEIYYNPETENFEKSVPTFSVAFDVYRVCLGHFTHDNAEAIIAAFTILLALSTIFLWVATRDLVRGADQTAKYQLRAYIGVSLKRAPEFNVGTVPKAIFDYKNFGQTPARDVRHWARIVIEPHPSEPRFEPTPFDAARVTVNPAHNESIVISLGRALTQNDVDTIRNDTARLYAHGEFWYFDIFGKEWRTEFRLMSGGQRMIEIQGMIRCAKGNAST